MSKILFIGSYVVTILCAMPSSLFFNLTAGFLFGFWSGLVCVLVGALLGTYCFFKLARFTMPRLSMTHSKKLSKLDIFKNNFQDNVFFYVIAIRLMPVLPFCFVNIVAFFSGVRLPQFLLATFLGILPATWIYVAMGCHLDHLMASGTAFSLHAALPLHIMITLFALALLMLLPIFFKKTRFYRDKLLTVR